MHLNVEQGTASDVLLLMLYFQDVLLNTSVEYVPSCMVGEHSAVIFSGSITERLDMSPFIQ